MSSKTFSLFFNRLVKWINRITEPLASVQGQEAREQSRLMTSLMLWISFMTLVMTFMIPLIRGEYPWAFPQFAGGLASAIFLIVLARLSQRGYHQFAALAGIIYTSCLLCAIVIAIGNNDGIYLLYSLMVIIVFCGLFLSMRITLTIMAAQSFGMLLVPSLAPSINFRTIINGPFSSYFCIAFLVVIVASHRRRFDAEQRMRLEVSEKRYKIISELISDYAFSAIVNADGSYNLEWMTESFTRFTGYTRDEARNFGNQPVIYHPDDTQRVVDDLARVLKGEAVDSEYRIITRDGNLRWSRIYRRPIWDAKQGRVVSFYGVAQNITERKQAEAALAEERNLLRTLIDNLPDQVFVKDQQSRFIIANVATARHLGFSSPDMLVGKSDFDLNMPTESAKQHFDDEQELMRSSEKPLTVEFTGHDSTNSENWYLSTKTPLHGRSGEVIGLVGINRNVTEIKRAEAQRHKMELERERLATVNRFTMAVSHDFRSSLTVIETNRYLAQRLLSLSEYEKVSPKLDKIKDGVVRMTDQIQNLNIISSLANPRPELCNLNGVMDYILNEHRKQAFAKNVEIFFQSDTNLPSTMADEEEIRSAIKHLLVNALNYTPEGGKIIMRTYQTDQYVSAEVSDTGPGIDRAEQERIFDLFYRVDSARGITLGGVGLGLSIVKMVAETHAGNIQVESEPGQGSTFTLSLPLKNGH